MKIHKMIAAFVCSAILFSGCSAPAINNAADTFTDALGQEIAVTHTITAAACSSSLAELWQLAGGELVGVTSDVYDEGRFEVPETAETVGSVKSPSAEKIIQLDPDIVLLSAEISEHTALQSALSGAGITTVYFSVETFDDYLLALDKCTDLTGHKELYEQNGAAVKKRVDAVIAKAVDKASPTVLYIRAYSTGAKAKGSDTMTGRMLADLNCTNIADTSGALKTDLSMEEIILRDPDFIFVTTMGSDTEKALKTLEENLMSNPAWSELTAVKNGKFRILPKELFHYKPNTKWDESYEMLYEILYENN